MQYIFTIQETKLSLFTVLMYHIIGWRHLGIVLGRKFDYYRRTALLDDCALVQKLLKFEEDKEIIVIFDFKLYAVTAMMTRRYILSTFHK